MKLFTICSLLACLLAGISCTTAPKGDFNKDQLVWLNKHLK